MTLYKRFHKLKLRTIDQKRDHIESCLVFRYMIPNSFMINQIQKTILSPVHYTTLAVLLVGMFLVVSCGDDASTENPSTEIPSEEKPSEEPSQDNSQCESSDPFLADDGCNTCTCFQGRTICTTLGCEPNDPDIVCTPDEFFVNPPSSCCLCPDSGIRAQSGCLDIGLEQACDDL